MFNEVPCLTRNMNKHRFPTILTISSGHLSSCADVCLHRKMLHSPNLPPSYCLSGFPIEECRCPSSTPSSQSSGGSYLGYVTFLGFLRCSTDSVALRHKVSSVSMSFLSLCLLPFGNPILLSIRSPHLLRLVKFIDPPPFQVRFCSSITAYPCRETRRSANTGIAGYSTTHAEAFHTLPLYPYSHGN